MCPTSCKPDRFVAAGFGPRLGEIGIGRVGIPIVSFFVRHEALFPLKGTYDSIRHAYVKFTCKIESRCDPIQPPAPICSVAPLRP